MPLFIAVSYVSLVDFSSVALQIRQTCSREAKCFEFAAALPTYILINSRTQATTMKCDGKIFKKNFVGRTKKVSAILIIEMLRCHSAKLL